MPKINISEVLRAVHDDIGKNVDDELIVLNDVGVAKEINARIGSELLNAVRNREKVTIEFPPGVLVVTPDFLEAMFGMSLEEVNSPDEFRRTFYISATTEVCVQISFAIDAIVMQRKVSS